jgi:hypothetical protein
VLLLSNHIKAQIDFFKSSKCGIGTLKSLFFKHKTHQTYMLLLHINQASTPLGKNGISIAGSILICHYNVFPVCFKKVSLWFCFFSSSVRIRNVFFKIFSLLFHFCLTETPNNVTGILSSFFNINNRFRIVFLFHNYRIVVLSDLISMVHGLLTGISANQVTTVWWKYRQDLIFRVFYGTINPNGINSSCSWLHLICG